MMSCKRVVTLFFVSVLLIAFGNVETVNAQSAKGSVKGIVIDAQSEEKLQYVNVAVLQTKDSSMVNCVITDQNGNFSIKNLRYGKYIVKFSFIGYRDVFKNVEIRVSVDGEKIFGKKKQIVTPGEMETVNLKPELVQKIKQGKEVTVELVK